MWAWIIPFASTGPLAPPCGALHFFSRPAFRGESLSSSGAVRSALDLDLLLRCGFGLGESERENALMQLGLCLAGDDFRGQLELSQHSSCTEFGILNFLFFGPGLLLPFRFDRDGS